MLLLLSWPLVLMKSMAGPLAAPAASSPSPVPAPSVVFSHNYCFQPLTVLDNVVKIEKHITLDSKVT